MKAPLLSIPGKSTPKDTFGIFTSALTNYLLNIFDSPAYYNLRTDYLRDHFNPATPDDPNVKYYSVAGRIAKLSVLHPLWFPKLVLDSAAEKGYPEGETPPGHAYEGNDGLVSVASSKWGEFMGVVDGCHHWDLRGEGGLWPATNSLKLSSESNTVLGLGDDIEATTRCESSDDKGPGAKPDEQLNRAQHDRDLATARLMSPGKTPDQAKPAGTNGWDMAMVGQLVDWVGDLFPGDKKDDERTSQLADAQKEMDARRESQAERAKTVVRDKFDEEGL
jgi:triacylglycerol lipase